MQPSFPPAVTRISLPFLLACAALVLPTGGSAATASAAQPPTPKPAVTVSLSAVPAMPVLGGGGAANSAIRPVAFSGRVLPPNAAFGGASRWRPQQVGWRLQQLEGELRVLHWLAEQQQRELGALSQVPDGGLPWQERLLAAAGGVLAAAGAGLAGLSAIRRYGRSARPGSPSP